jgi:hypothetical protein
MAGHCGSQFRQPAVFPEPASRRTVRVVAGLRHTRK